jgi:hypothetical protein
VVGCSAVRKLIFISFVTVTGPIRGKSWRSNNDNEDVVVVMMMMIIIIINLVCLSK